MPETLTVHLNRSEPREVAPEAATLETGRSFVLAFENHGGPTHVHLHLDDALDAVARPTGTQVYVEGDSTRRVEVNLLPDHSPVKGYIDISTGYGAEKARVNVTVTDPRKDGGADVAIDDSLAEKQTENAESTTSASETAETTKPVAVAVVGVAVATALALSVSEGLGLVVGGLALLCGVGAAGYLLYGQS
ncbi:DUF7524 family protein [Halobacterium zhouii]|uniref:DUF7524 family protein n=1 Tax=Halobacterium zhouii TaxID=2902624 RepID=UPI001E286364|nr:hypothetical protein [Halobacterium zhouii]